MRRQLLCDDCSPCGIERQGTGLRPTSASKRSAGGVISGLALHRTRSERAVALAPIPTLSAGTGSKRTAPSLLIGRTAGLIPRGRPIEE